MRLNSELSDENEYKTKRAEIETEIKRLEKERAGVKYHTDDWTKRAEKSIHYAFYATEKLEHGDYIEKSGVLADLGSNFLINMGLLLAGVEPMLQLFQKYHEIVNKDLVGFELEDKLLNQAKSEILKSWLGNRDSVTNKILLNFFATPARRCRACALFSPLFQ